MKATRSNEVPMRRLMQLQRRVRAAATKRDAVDLLCSEAGVTRAWACRHLKRISLENPHVFASAVVGASPAGWWDA